MSMYPHEVGAIPPETASVVRAACPKGTLSMRWRDALGTVFTDEDFVALYAVKGQPGDAPWRLALVTVLQYVDGLTDRQAAAAQHPGAQAGLAAVLREHAREADVAQEPASPDGRADQFAL